MTFEQFKFRQRIVTISCLSVTFFFQQVCSQRVAINDNGALPDKSSILDINSSTGGLLIPRFATTDLGNINAPANGLMIFNTTTSSFQFYDANASNWGNVGRDAVKPSGISGSIQFNNNGIFGNSNKLFWDNVNGRLAIGNNMPQEMLDISGDIRVNGISIGLGNGAQATNMAVGTSSLKNNTIGSQNTAAGNYSLYKNTSGISNTASGYLTLFSNTSGSSNVGNGALSLYNNDDGSSNTAIGFMTIYNNKSGGQNTVVGSLASFNLDGGFSNTTIGAQAGFELTTGGNNTIVGSISGMGITTGSNNTIIGASVSGLDPALSNNIIIADGSGNRRINVNSSGLVGIGTDNPTQKLHIKDGHIKSEQSQAPNILVQTQNGITNAAISGTDVKGSITCTGANNGTDTEINVTFNITCTNAPIVTITPANQAAYTANWFVTSTANGFTLTFKGGNADPKFNYIAIE